MQRFKNKHYDKKKFAIVYSRIFRGTDCFRAFCNRHVFAYFACHDRLFHTTSSQVQLGLTASMIGLAVGQLFFGPLSDKYGRRRPLIIAMCLFLLATLGCLYSRTIMQFVGWRLIQGMAGAGGIVISRSIAADKYSGRELAKMLAIIGAINGVAPVAAPIAGGSMADSVGWHGIFGYCSDWVFYYWPGACISRILCPQYVVRMPAGAMFIGASWL